jgi:hypothetical protein
MALLENRINKESGSGCSWFDWGRPLVRQILRKVGLEKGLTPPRPQTPATPNPSFWSFPLYSVALGKGKAYRVRVAGFFLELEIAF